MTDARCPKCRDAEMTTTERIGEQLRALMGVYRTDRIFAPLADMVRGGWYRIHQDDYVRTGQRIHLIRMLRHVTLENPDSTSTPARRR